jgi:hypothetical protein
MRHPFTYASLYKGEEESKIGRSPGQERWPKRGEPFKYKSPESKQASQYLINWWSQQVLWTLREFDAGAKSGEWLVCCRTVTLLSRSAEGLPMV